MSTDVPPQGLDELADALRPLVFQLYYVTRRHGPQIELTITQASVLRHLVSAGHPMRMTELAEAEGVQLPSMTNVVTRMQRLDLVKRAPDPVDGRATQVHLTPAGEQFLQRIVQLRNEFLSHRLSTLDADDRAAIADALPALRRLVGKEGSSWSAAPRAGTD
ncbi:MAG TPA: MarR family transcriptional regulator [Pseudonocardiaceae bacterium]|nr:MarR family transcriptional regulator [Pseudonocardiaceae bacterium]